jgi:hypothetical protein
MFKTAYDTTACQKHIIQPTINAILQHSAVTGNQFRFAVNPLTEDTIYSVKTVLNGPAVIPAFGHPLAIEQKLFSDEFGDQDDKPRYRVFVDVRNFTRISATDDYDEGKEVDIKSKMDYHFAVMRGFFQHVWLRYGARDLLNIGNYQIKIYSRWLSDILTKRFALPPDVQMTLVIISAYFYQCLFLDDNVTELDESMKLKFATQVASATYISAEDAMRVIDTLPVIRNLDELVNIIQSQSGTVRLEQFNVALLFTATSGSWFGPNNVEVTHVALEHPPTFIAMIISAANEKGYRNTSIGKLVDQYDGDDELKPFLLNAKRLQRED